MPGAAVDDSDDSSERLSVAASSHDSVEAAEEEEEEEEEEEGEATQKHLAAPSSPEARANSTAEASPGFAEESIEELPDDDVDEDDEAGERSQGDKGLSAAEVSPKKEALVVPLAAGKAPAVFTASDGTSFSDRGAYRKYEFALSYTFAGRQGGEELLQLRKAPGSIDGQPFVLEKLRRCEVQLLDHSEAVQADYLEDCRVFIAASCDSVFVRNCTGCTFTVACKQASL